MSSEQERTNSGSSDEAMTHAQAARLASLTTEAGETFDSGLSRAAAAKRIEELQRKIGRAPLRVAGGDGGTSIRANESASGQDETPPSGATAA